MLYWSHIESICYAQALPCTSNELSISMVEPMRPLRKNQMLLLTHWFSGGLCKTCTALPAQRAGCPSFGEG